MYNVKASLLLLQPLLEAPHVPQQNMHDVYPAPEQARDQVTASGRARSVEDWFEMAQAAASSQAPLGGSVIRANRGGVIVRLDNGLGGAGPFPLPRLPNQKLAF